MRIARMTSDGFHFLYYRCCTRQNLLLLGVFNGQLFLTDRRGIPAAAFCDRIGQSREQGHGDQNQKECITLLITAA